MATRRVRVCELCGKVDPDWATFTDPGSAYGDFDYHRNCPRADGMVLGRLVEREEEVPRKK